MLLLLLLFHKELAMPSQESPYPLLFTSSCVLLLLIGQLSKVQIFLWYKNVLWFIFSAVIEQSLFSYLIIQIKFFIQSQSMSSSQISGIQSLSISHLYFHKLLFIIASKHTSCSEIISVAVVSKSIHSFI